MSKSSWRRSSIVGWCAFAFAACSDATAPAKVDPVGDYALQSINNRSLPFLLFDFAGAFQIYQLSGTLALNANRTFLERDSLRFRTAVENGFATQDSVVTITGIWESQQDSIVTLTQTRDGEVLFGVARRMSLTLTYLSSQDSAVTMLYRKK